MLRDCSLIASERIKRAQANAHALPKKHNKRAASVTYTATATSTAANTAATSPAYVGRQNDTSTCTNQPTSDGCTDPVYTIGKGTIDLSNGGKMPASGHVNFQVGHLSAHICDACIYSELTTFLPQRSTFHTASTQEVDRIDQNHPAGRRQGVGCILIRTSEHSVNCCL